MWQRSSTQVYISQSSSFPQLFGLESSTSTFRLKENEELRQVWEIMEPNLNHSTLLNYRSLEVLKVTSSLQATKQLVYLSNEADLLTKCRQTLHDSSKCFTTVVFNDSPSTTGKKQTWTYKIHANNQYNGDDALPAFMRDFCSWYEVEPV
jgi:hypothetical protein